MGDSRYKLMLKTLGKRAKVVGKLPLTIEMLGYLRINIHRSKSRVSFEIVWAGILLGFSFLLRASELMQLCVKDLTLESDQIGDFVSVFIKGSKTDVKNQGVFRSLYRSNTRLCIVHSMELFLSVQKQNGLVLSDLLFPHNFLYSLRTTIKWLAACCGLNIERFSVHSMRSGGGQPPCPQTECQSTTFAVSADGRVPAFFATFTLIIRR